MGGLQKACLAGSLAFWAGPLAAASELRQAFLVCAGRLSALEQHQWLMQEDGADRTGALRDAVLDLVAALPGDPTGDMSLRIAAKQAHAMLLRRSVFNGDPRDAARAARLAGERVSVCRSHVLAGGSGA